MGRVEKIWVERGRRKVGGEERREVVIRTASIRMVAFRNIGEG